MLTPTVSFSPEAVSAGVSVSASASEPVASAAAGVSSSAVDAGVSGYFSPQPARLPAQTAVANRIPNNFFFILSLLFL